MVVAEATTRSALGRKESRGAHFREDFEGKDEALGKVITICKKGTDGEMQCYHEDIPEMPDELKQIIEENQQ
jgi:succinate dehydrogenase/fumarate reductase flavoprotein subunit